VSKLWLDDPGFGSQKGNETFLFSKWWAHPASYLINTRSSFVSSNGQGMKVTTYLHLVARLRTSGTIPLTQPFAFICAEAQIYLLNVKFGESSKSEFQSQLQNFE
jgi:hypothetical protein